jgi:hypothetical protein
VTLRIVEATAAIWASRTMTVDRPEASADEDRWRRDAQGERVAWAAPVGEMLDAEGYLVGCGEGPVSDVAGWSLLLGRQLDLYRGPTSSERAWRENAIQPHARQALKRRSAAVWCQIL